MLICDCLRVCLPQPLWRAEVLFICTLGPSTGLRRSPVQAFAGPQCRMWMGESLVLEGLGGGSQGTEQATTHPPVVLLFLSDQQDGVVEPFGVQ